MSAYLLGQVTVHDPDGFRPYIRETSELIARHGGEVLDVVRASEVLEGAWPAGALTALVRFPSEEALRAFWDSPGNQRMKKLRNATSTSNVAICLSLSGEERGG